MRLHELQYHIVSGKSFALTDKNIYERAYKYWQLFWQNFFEENKIGHELRSDDFFRQDFVGVITYHNQIIALLLFTVFDLNSQTSDDHTYFIRGYKPEYIDLLRKEGARTAMSYEYLTVNPEFRKTLGNTSFAAVSVGLGGELQKYLNIDVGMGVSRKDLKVTDLVQQFGWRVMIPNVEMYKKHCDQSAIFTADLKSHSDPAVMKLVKELWNKRIDLTGITVPNVRKLKAA